jgi:hypothetical protein
MAEVVVTAQARSEILREVHPARSERAQNNSEGLRMTAREDFPQPVKPRPSASPPANMQSW